MRVEVAELKRRANANGDVEALRAELKESTQKVAETVAFLNAQADAAKSLIEVLQDSEAKGFTFGINPQSRIVMLAGFRAFLEGMQKNVPGRKPEAEPEADQ